MFKEVTKTVALAFNSSAVGRETTKKSRVSTRKTRGVGGNFGKLYFVLMLFGALSVFNACDEPEEEIIPVESISLNKTSFALVVGGTETLTATVNPSDATDKTVTWKSSSTSVATVDNNGAVKAIAKGTATITATAGGKSASCLVTVSENVVAVTSVTLNKTTLSLTVDKTETLTATVNPSNATDKTVTWTTSNASVATVSSNGTVTAIAAGTATITAKAGAKTATCTVTVTLDVTEVTLNKTSLDLCIGDTTTLTATVKPSNENKSVTWTSSNTSVAGINTNTGLITARAEGTATITAKCGDKTATCTLNVNPTLYFCFNSNFTVVSGSGAYTAYSIKSLEAVPGEEIILKAKTNPSGQPVTWTSSNTSKATVEGDYDFGTVTTKSAGTVTITATYQGKTASCTLTIVEVPKQVTVNGVVWSNYNVDAPGTFTTDIADMGMQYQWNRKIGWAGSISSPAGYTWSDYSKNYASGTVWATENNPCPQGWRIPNSDEMKAVVGDGPYEFTRTATSHPVIMNGNLFCVIKHATGMLILPGVVYYGGTNLWTSSPSGADKAYAEGYRIEDYIASLNVGHCFEGSFSRSDLRYVRCVK
jgi:uncharacterized protein YjdB